MHPATFQVNDYLQKGQIFISGLTSVMGMNEKHGRGHKKTDSWEPVYGLGYHALLGI
ncbi:hypothetical protein [Photobacterium nomapromontoriensis]|uniref:hypothetical protein n=1 Tax=Photobacterium nomapromontoriensis TaxID=2910237 RepID=UPI003D0A74B2